MKKIFQRYPFFLLFLPLFIVLRIEKIYDSLIIYHFVTKEILILFIFPLLVYAICFLLLKSVLKSNLLSFIILLFFYFSGETKNFLSEKFSDSFIQSYSFLFSLIGIFIITSYILIKRKVVNLKVSLFLNTTILLLVIIETAGIVFKTSPKPIVKNSFTRVCNDCEKSDIYYIIFDSYASSSLLKKEFGYDNTAIETFLTQKGFRILRDSRSNYNLTPFSLASILNMDYIANTDTTNKLHVRDYWPAINYMYYNNLFSAIKEQGYSVYNHSLFDFKDHPSSVQIFDIWKIKNIYEQYNFIKKIYTEIGWNLPSWLRISFGKYDDYLDNRDRHDSSALQHLYKTIVDTLDKPKFVYTHFFLPHSPYSFDSVGNKIRLSYDLSLKEDKEAYIQQLAYTNKIVKKVVDSIQAGSGGKAIIIIQGDHGYRFFDDSKKQLEFSNLNAIYFPNADYHLFYDSMTSVNTFRIVFNTLFNQNYTMLPDQTYPLKYK